MKKLFKELSELWILIFYLIPILAVLLFYLTELFPTIPKTTFEESQKRFPVYESILEKTVSNYGYEFKEHLGSSLVHSEKERTYDVNISETESLRINISYTSRKLEHFSVSYKCDNSKTEHEFNVDLFY